MYFVKPPGIVRKIFNNVIWNLPYEEKTIFLTFDDGPTPEVTTKILAELDNHTAKATFFCIGENIKYHHDIFKSILRKGHTVGNHTYNHINGWQCNLSKYLRNINLCQKLVKTNLFRPPYGKISLSQLHALKRSGNYEVVMWDVLSYDYHHKVSKEKCLQNVLNNTQNGSIILFHDSIKAKDKVMFVLPKVLEYYSKKGYTFKGLDSNAIAQLHHAV